MVKFNDKEKELIECIRNYNKSFPNGEQEQRFYIMQLVAELMDEHWT